MRYWISLCAWMLCCTVPTFAQTDSLRIFLRGGVKTHGPGEHDHPRFVDEWKELLSSRGATVDGALTFPTAAQLERTDVLVLYAAEGGSIHGEERTNLERFLARGGGIVVLHDAICGDDPQWFKTVVGGAWEHGFSRWHTDEIDLYLSETRHAITEGAANFRFKDEIYWKLHMMPEAKPLMVGFHSVFDITPQMWTYEKNDYRAFVSIQGHYHDSFAHESWRTLLLRGIAWAGKRDTESLLKPGEAAALRYPPGGPTRPSAADTLIDVHPEFDLSLVAAEPLVVKPIAIDWDPRGRMWVAMTPGYPHKEQFSGVKAHDELAILVDHDNDGRSDERKTFYRGLDLVTSFVLHRDGAIVSAAPDILWLRDTDGDDVCDAVERVFTGFGFGDTHATISNFRWGPDGWIYATQGYSGGASNHVTNAAGRDFGKIGNGLFRFRPDGSAIEVVSSYGSNTWGCSFTPEGELFFTMANGAHLRHVVLPEKFLAGNRVDNVTSWKDVPDHDRLFPAVVRTEAPYAQIDFVGGFTAAAGSTFYDGGAWPEAWNTSHFVCEPTVNLVHHDVVEPEGVSFVARKTREQEFITSRDLWFRPVDARVGPDGALYVLDFYNQAVVHNDTRGPQHGPTNAAIRPDRDHVHGRIWRVQHKLARPTATAFPLPNEPERAVALLEHPNAWVRQTAARIALESNHSTVRTLALKRLELGTPEHSAIAAAWLASRAGASSAEIAKLLRDSRTSPGLVRAILRILCESPVALDPSDWFTCFTFHANGTARTQLLLQQAIAELVNSDRWVEMSPVLPRMFIRSRSPWLRASSVRLASRNLVAYLRGLVAEKASDDSILPSAVAAVLAGGSEKNLSELLTVLVEPATNGNPEVQRRVLAAVASSARKLEPGVRDVASRSLAALLRSSDEDVATSALPLTKEWGLAEELAREVDQLGGRLQRRLDDAGETHARRSEALGALLSIADRRAKALSSVAGLFEASSAPDEHARLLGMLQKTDDAAAARVIVDYYAKFGLEARDMAFEQLLARAEWTAVLLERIESGAIARAELGPQKVHRLRTHPDARTAQRATKLFEALAGASNTEIDAMIAKLVPLVDQPGGDRVRGKVVFDQNCAACHTAFGVGGNVGPDLSGIGTHGARDLLPIILDPNRTVEAAYAEWVITTFDERNYAGVLVRESTDSVALRSSYGEVVVERADIDQMRNTGRSPMPTGFEGLGDVGLRDLITYLAGDFAHWRVLDLKPVVSSNSMRALYDSKRDDKPYVPARFGVVAFDDTPFEFLDPRRTESGNNALVLKGGLVADWESKLRKPQRVEIRVGAVVQRVHVLGGIAGWGFPYVQEKKPIVKWTWIFADGTSEEHVLHNGVEFADWIGQFDVPGSEFVEGALAEDSWGQLRRFAVAPASVKQVERIVLESYDNELAPTILAMTVELPGAPQRAEKPVLPLEVLIFGGGSSHDFAQWYDRTSTATLKAAGIGDVRYTASLNDAARQLAALRALVLCTNQSVANETFRAGLFAHIESGGGLLALHPATWFNWSDWPEYNSRLVGGGSRSHEKLQEFEVRIVDAAHPITRGVPATFRIVDELYRFERAATDAEIRVLAIGRSLETGLEYPVLWTVERTRGRTVGLTLGHDGRAHELEAFQLLLTNSVRWISER